MKKSFVKRLLSGVLVTAMVCSLLPLGIGTFAKTAHAEEIEGGTWVLTSEEHFAYKDGKEQYVSKQNEYYKYVCSYKGVNDKNQVVFEASGGFYGNNDSSTVDAYHLCTLPEKSYAADALVTLTLTNYEENVTDWLHGGSSSAELKPENKEADGIEYDHFVYNNKGPISAFKPQGSSNYSYSVGMGKSETLVARMPAKAENGTRIAIVFYGSTAYDSWSGSKQSDYGGTMWYTWIYTYQAKATATPGKDSTSTVTTPTTTTNAAKKITVGKVKKFKLKNKKGRTLYLSYKKVKGAAGYNIKYATNKKLKKAKSFNASVTKGYMINAQGKRVKFIKGKTYYAKVRAYKIDSSGKRIYGKWSARKKAKIRK